MAQLQPYMPLIIMAVIGIIAGWLAGLLLGGGGLFRNLVVGVIGSFIGGFLVNQGLLKLPIDFNVYIPTFGNQIVVSTIGAVLVVILARLLAR